jgi:very-short-patch-repair endonuclease
MSRKEYYDEFFKKNDEGFCKICGKETSFNRDKYSNYCRGCSNKDPNVKLKKKKTCLDHYGVEFPLQSSVIQSKIKETCLQKYGVENPNQNIEIKNKKKKTCLRNYGVENPYQSENIQNKYKQTCLQKYGVDNPSKLKLTKEKIKNTCIKKYGVENPSQSNEHKIKHKKTCFKNYGVENPSQSNIIKEKKKHTCLKNWNSEYFVSSDKGRLMARKYSIERIENQKNNGEPLVPCIGNDERKCLNELQKYTNFEIKRNPKIIGYFPDGYIEELNLIIEFDERHHFTDEWLTYSESDIQKDKDYEKEGFQILRIKKLNWEQNQNGIINRFKEIINE